MELAVHFIDFLPGDPAELGPTLADAAKAAEQGGATLFTLADHFLQMEKVGRAHGEYFGTIRPATSMVEVSKLISLEMLVEMEADAVVEA